MPEGSPGLLDMADRLAAAPRPGPSAVETIRLAGVDLLGCVLAGAETEVARRARTATTGWGSGAAAIYGTEHSAPAPAAAFANAVAAHALDFDDWESPGNSHASAVLLPAIWATAAERRLTGADAVVAYHRGFEVIAALGETLNFSHYNRGWHTTGTLGALGAAAAAASARGLDVEATAHALSLAVSQAGGLTRQFGSTAKPLQAGFAAQAGVTAAALAAAGLTGRLDVMEGPRGFAELTAGGAGDGAAARIDGRALERHGVVLKPYPSCGYTHRLIDAALALRARLSAASAVDDPAVDDPVVDEIVEIIAELPDFHAAVLPFQKPATRHEALFSIPHCVAVALSRGAPRLQDFDAAALAAPELRALAAKTRVIPHAPARPDLNYDPDAPDRLTLRFASGEAAAAEIAFPLGAPQKPMAPAAVRAKAEALSGWPAGPARRAAFDAAMDWCLAPDLSQRLTPFAAREAGVERGDAA